MSGTTSGSMFADPTTMGLLGMAQGFAQAAMPSRMPVPFGAALGMGAAGMSQGAMAANQFALQQQQLEAAKISNERNRALMNFFGAGLTSGNGNAGGSGAGTGVAYASQGSAGSSGASGGSGNGYLMNPQTIKSYADMMAMAGQDRAAATLYGMLGSMAGGPGYAMGANGAAFAVPGGGKDPGTLFRNAYSEGMGGVVPAGLKAGAEASAQAQYKNPVEVDVPDGKGGFTKRTVFPSQFPAFVGSQEGTGASMPLSTFVGKVTYGESGNNDQAQNDKSSAGGRGQFIDGTWLQTFKQAYPQQAQGMSDDQILALKGNKDLSNQMVAAYAQQNAAALQGAGLPVNAATLGLAHRFGAAGATQLLQAPSYAPVAKVMSPDVIRANPELANQTVGQVVGNTFLKFGNSPVALSGPSVGIAGPPVLTPQQKADMEVDTKNREEHNAAVYRPVTVTVSDGKGGQREVTTNAASLPGMVGQPGAVPAAGQIVGKPVMTPEQEAESKGYGEQSASIINAGFKAPVSLQRLEVIENAAKDFRPGATAEMRLAAGHAMAGVLQDMGITPPDWLVKGVAGGETIGKEGGYLAAEMTRALGSREAASVFAQIKNIQPHIEMSQGGFQVIVNSLRQGLQRDQDLATYREKWLADPSHNGSIRGMQDSFEKDYPIQAYASRVLPYPMPKSQSSALPNVIYNTARGPALWDGSKFISVASAQ